MSSIDVVIPCFQYGRFLRDSVGSVLQQGIDSLRILIIDNGSTDDSVDIARQLANEHDRIEVAAHRRNLGPINSFNEGIDWASADYFMLLDADDLLAPECLHRAISVMDEHPRLAFCYGGEQCISHDAAAISTELSAQGLDAEWRFLSGMDFIRRVCSRGHNVVGNPTAIRRTRIQKLIGHYDPDLTYATDMNMWLRLATRGDVAETSAVQGIRRLHPDQMTQAYRTAPVMDLVEHFNNFEHFFRHEGSELPTVRKERGRATRRIAFNGLHMAASLMLAGRFRPSMPCIQFSLKTYAGLTAQFLRQHAPRGGGRSAADAGATAQRLP